MTEKTYACSKETGVCCGVGVNRKHWNGYSWLCANTLKPCKYRVKID